MISRAMARFVRISPRKVRYVIDLIRKKPVPQAQAILNAAPRRGAEIVRKLLNQAVDAAEKNSKADPRNLFISKVTADGGPSMKRFRAASMGRASSILKRTSHIYLELDLAKQKTAPAPPRKPSAGAALPKGQPGIEMGKKAPKKKEAKKLVGAK